MQFARCTLDGRDLAAAQFEALDDCARSTLKGKLVCCECQGRAHFRRRSTNGHAACFAAHHSQDCPEAVRSDSPWPESGDEEVARWEANRNKIVLAISSEGDETEPATRGNGARTPGEGRTRHRKDGPAFGSMIQRGATNLLRQLVNWPSFKTSVVHLVLPDGTEVPVHSFFTRMQDASVEQHVGSLHGVWGIVHSVEDWVGRGVWINSPPAYNRTNLRTLIPSSLHALICQKFGLKSIQDLMGRYILVIGKPRISTGGLFMTDVYDVQKFSTVVRPENDPNQYLTG